MSPLQSAVLLDTFAIEVCLTETEAKLDITLPKRRKIISRIRPQPGLRLLGLSWVALETLPHLDFKCLSDLDCASAVLQNSSAC